MPTFQNVYPRVNNATDLMDSAHLVGIMVFVGQHIDINMVSEYVNPEGYLMRCPINNGCDLEPNNYKNCTRDQLIPFIAALYQLKQYGTLRKVISNVGFRMWNTETDKQGSTKKFPNGPDILDPSHHGYIRILTDRKPLLIQKLWMLARIYINGKFTALKEPNNIIIMSYYYGYLEILKKRNPKLKEAINLYWNGWRGEPEIARDMIKKIGL